jgi:glutathione S-transferase
MTDGKYTLTYWQLRGLVAVPQMLLILSGLPHEVVLTNTPWPKGSYDASAEVLPLINLPYLTLPTGEVIAQSGAVIRVLAAKCAAVKPADDVAFALCEQALEHFQDFQKEWNRLTYGPDFEATKVSFLGESAPYFFGALDKQMQLQGSNFIAGASMTAADLVLYEHVERLIAMTGSTDAIKGMPKVLAVHAAVKALPALQAYHAGAATMAFNGPQAHWSPAGARA